MNLHNSSDTDPWIGWWVKIDMEGAAHPLDGKVVKVIRLAKDEKAVYVIETGELISDLERPTSWGDHLVSSHRIWKEADPALTDTQTHMWCGRFRWSFEAECQKALDEE